MKNFVKLGLVFALVLMCDNPIFSCTTNDVKTSPVNNPLKKTGYNLVLSDEFNGSNVNPYIWDNSGDGVRTLTGNKELQYYTKRKNYELSSGMLNLVTKKEAVTARAIDYFKDDTILSDGITNLRTFNYTSGLIRTFAEYQFGYFEIKCKVPSGKGMWPAFWLYGHGTCNDEIDVFEFEGENSNYIINTWHADCNRSTEKFRIIQSSYADNASYTYAVEWTPSQVKWYLNNTLIRTINHYYPSKMWVEANSAVASGYVFGGPPPSNANFFPAKFEIDYIRIYQKDNDILPEIKGPNEIVKTYVNQYTNVKYSSLPSTWQLSSGLDLYNGSGQGTYSVPIYPKTDGPQTLILTVTLENGSKVSTTKNILVVSSVPSQPAYINGPSNISGTLECPSGQGCFYVFPSVTYTTDYKANASSYSWSISPNDGSVELDPSNTYCTIRPYSSANNRSYVLQVKDCNILGCSPVFSKTISVSSGGFVVKSAKVIEDSLTISTSISKNTTLSDCQVYPNPADDKLSISFPTEDNYSIMLIDTRGIVLRNISTSNSNTIINVNDIPNGLYILRIDNSKEVLQKKVQILR